ncbi:MAG: hypothetical protein IKX53_03055 [Bacteroidales bacterium]|nr:hypothetical protein [Bacteroidales bacterium]
MKRFWLLLPLVSLLLAAVVQAQPVSPLDFGLDKAQTGTERYAVLLRAHQSALAQGRPVSYAGIDSLEIDIPSSADPIPLPDVTDFAGLVLTVRNTVRSGFLFQMSQELRTLDLDREVVAQWDFRKIPVLNEGVKLLVVEDRTPWVKQRKGYSYGATRRDITLLRNGVARSKPIQPYTTAVSNPKVSYCAVTLTRKEIRNLTLLRTGDSSRKTYAFLLENQNNIVVENVRVETPASNTMNADQVFAIRNCTNVLFTDVTISGTYSQLENYGYGIAMDNVWKSRFVRLKADAAWGIFGNNNINGAQVEDSDINRLDVHCYGRDIYCLNTTFRDLYNQFASFFGYLTFEGCRFIHFVPVLFESSYNAFTFYEIMIKDCSIQVDGTRPWLINAGQMAGEANERPELSKKYLPSVLIDGLEVTAPKNVFSWYMIHFNDTRRPLVENTWNVDVRNLTVQPATLKVRLSNLKLPEADAFQVFVRSWNWKLNQNELIAR